MDAQITGIWDDTHLFTRYRVGIRFTHMVMGGTPQKPELIEAWLYKRITGGDEELRLALIKTLEDVGIDVPGDASRDEIIEAAKKMAATRNGNTFRRNGHGLYLEDYKIKAMLKEATAILFPYQDGHKWGATKKAPRSFLAERVFVDEHDIPLERAEPDGTHMQVGHITGPKGPRSTLTYYDYCLQPEIAFTVSSLNDCIAFDQWKAIFLLGQRIGLGALRSLGHGQFRVTGFEQV